MFVIEDSNHTELQGEFASIDDALAELVRRSTIPWYEEPNRAPCGSWETCGRYYEMVEYDDSSTPWRLINQVFVLEITSTGIKWANEFKDKVKNQKI